MLKVFALAGVIAWTLPQTLEDHDIAVSGVDQQWVHPCYGGAGSFVSRYPHERDLASFYMRDDRLLEKEMGTLAREAGMTKPILMCLVKNRIRKNEQ